MGFKPPSGGVIGGIVATITVTGLAVAAALNVSGPANFAGPVTADNIHATNTAVGLVVDGRSTLTGQATTTAGIVPATSGGGTVGSAAFPYGAVHATLVQAGTGNFTSLNRGAFQVCTSDGTGCPGGGGGSDLNWEFNGTDSIEPATSTLRVLGNRFIATQDGDYGNAAIGWGEDGLSHTAGNVVTVAGGGYAAVASQSAFTFYANLLPAYNGSQSLGAWGQAISDIYASGTGRIANIFATNVTSTNGDFTNLTRGGSSVCTEDGTDCPAGGVNYWSRTGTELTTATPGDGVTLSAVTTTALIVTGPATTTFQNNLNVTGSVTSTFQNGLSAGSIAAGNAYISSGYLDHVYSIGDSRFDSLVTANGITVNSLVATSTQFMGNVQPGMGAVVNMGTGSNRFNDGYFDNFHVSTSTVTGSFVYSGSMPASFVSGGISVSGNSSIMGTFSAGTSTLYNLSTMTTSTLQGLVLNGGVQISDDTQFLVSGKLVCLADGTNCSGGGGGGSDANWTFNPTGYNGEPTVSMVTSTAWLQTGAISIHTSTTDSLLTLQNDNSSKDVGITFRNSAGDGSVFSLSFTGPDSAEAPPNLGFFDIATSTTNFLFLPQNDGAPSPWMGFNNTSGNTEVYSGLVLQPFDFGFIGAPATYAPIISHNSATSSLNYADLATIGEEDLTITVTGAADGDDCERGVPNALASRTGEVYSCFVSAADTITVRRTCNLVAGCGNPSAAEVRASFWKH